MKRARITSGLLSFLFLAWSSCLGQSAYPKALPGPWSGFLRVGENSVPIEFVITGDGNKLGGALLNGGERIPFSNARYEGGVLTLELAQVEARLRAKYEVIGEDMPTLRGEYTMTGGKGPRFFVQAVHLLIRNGVPVVKQVPNEDADAETIWGAWHYRLSNSFGEAVENGTLDLARGGGPRAEATAKLASSERGNVALRGIGINAPQMPTESQLEAWVKSGKEPAKADLRTVETIAFHGFDGRQAIALLAELQSDGALAGTLWVNSEQYKFWARRAAP